MKRRGFGEGSVAPSGRGFRVRVRVEGKREDLGTYATQEEAEGIRKGWQAAQAAGDVPSGALTLRGWGKRWLRDRELAGSRNVASDKSRWHLHILTAPFAEWPLKSIERRDVKAWLKKLRETAPGWQTRKHALTLLRRALGDAMEDEVVDRNVAAGIKFARPDEANDKWTFLLHEEQTRLATCELPAASPAMAFARQAERFIALVAIGSGLRQGEQWNLELRDVHVKDASPWLFVRWGSMGKTPKGGKTRRVPLFGVGLAAMRAWLAVLPQYAKRNEHGLVFPTPRGCRRQKSKQPATWASLLATAKLDVAPKRHDGRTVRWHDLRHTCASSLLAGWWGRRWTLEEVRDLLGHSSVTITERYAHLAPTVIAETASKTAGFELGPSLGRALPPAPRANSGDSRRVTVDSNHRPSAPEGEAIRGDYGHIDLLRATLRAKHERYLGAITARSRFAHRFATDALEAAYDMIGALEALAAPAAKERAS